MTTDVLWPRCGKCHKATDVKQDPSGKLWASCCGERVAVRLAIVRSDAKALKLNERSAK